MMDYNASVTYRTPTTRNQLRAEAANREGRFLGFRCPVCGRAYTGGKGYCPVDTIELTEDHEIDLPQRGTVSNYTIITPVQYPGQSQTEPFPRVHVKLDGVDVVVGYQALLEVPNEQVRIGMRVVGRLGFGGRARRAWTSARRATSSAGYRRVNPTSRILDS